MSGAPDLLWGLPRWGVMWCAAIGVIVAAKVVLARGVPCVDAAWWLWPGMDPLRFRGAPKRHPTRREEAFAFAFVAMGAVLVWGVVPRMAAPALAAWAGLIGLGLILHVGVARLMSTFWRRRGHDAQPLFDRPLASRSLDEFWGRRWNRGFSDAVRVWIFRPVSRRYGARLASLCTFAVSGLGHDALLSLPAGGGFGLCTAYFAIQAVGVQCERAGLRHRAFTLAVVGLPLPLLFHEPFLSRVLSPFLAAIGARPA